MSAPSAPLPLPRLLLAAGCLLAVATTTTAPVWAAVSQKTSYVIKGQPIADSPTAVAQLRRFLPQSMDRDERCQRIAVLLEHLANHKTNAFQVAEFALARPQLIRDRFAKRLDVETLRNSYIESILQFKERRRVDGGLVELVDCLRTKFFNIDAKARSFLNEPTLKAILEQYQQIVGHTADHLRPLEDNQQRINLKWDELEPLIQETVASWFNGDLERAKSLFVGASDDGEPEEAPLGTPPPQLASSASHEEEEIVEATEASFAEPPAAPDAQAEPAEPAASEAQDETNHLSAASEVESEKQAQVAGSLADEPVLAIEEPQLEEDDTKLLMQIYSTLANAYHKLPIDSVLNDRCRIYNEIIQAREEQLFDPQLADRLAAGLEEKLKSARGQRAPEAPFVPQKNDRENFLFVLQTIDAIHWGPGLWVELSDCASLWQDQDVRAYFESPEHKAVVDQLTQLPDDNVVASVQLVQTPQQPLRQQQQQQQQQQQHQQQQQQQLQPRQP